MLIDKFLCVGFVFASLFFTIATFVALLWTLFGRRGESRKRRLRIAFSSSLLLVAAISSTFSCYHFLLLPNVMPIVQPAFKPPYDRERETLAILAPCLIFASVSAFIWAQRQSSAKQTTAIRFSLGSLLLFLTTSAVNYFVFYRLQLPAFDHYVMIELNGNWLTRVGDQAPNVTVTMLDGSPVQLSELRGKVVLLNFFATWCRPCLSEMPHLEEIWNQRKDNPNFRMLVIGRDETTATIAPFKEQHGFTFPMAVDPDASAFRKFADEFIPRTYLISRNGKILFQTHGFAEIEVYQRELATLQQTMDKELASAR
jgi:peroxiredoxin